MFTGNVTNPCKQPGGRGQDHDAILWTSWSKDLSRKKEHNWYLSHGRSSLFNAEMIRVNHGFSNVLFYNNEMKLNQIMIFVQQNQSGCRFSETPGEPTRRLTPQLFPRRSAFSSEGHFGIGTGMKAIHVAALRGRCSLQFLSLWSQPTEVSPAGNPSAHLWRLICYFNTSLSCNLSAPLPPSYTLSQLGLLRRNHNNSSTETSNGDCCSCFNSSWLKRWKKKQKTKANW